MSNLPEPDENGFFTMEQLNTLRDHVLEGGDLDPDQWGAVVRTFRAERKPKETGSVKRAGKPSTKKSVKKIDLTQFLTAEVPASAEAELEEPEVVKKTIDPNQFTRGSA